MRMRLRFGWSTIFCAVLMVAALRLAGAQDQHSATQNIRVSHVSRAPRLNDFITGQKREAELEISDFRQREPQDGSPASQPTKAFISYDDHNLYVAFVCKADPSTLRARMTKRDQISGDDAVSVSLDTFHDRQRAYEFFSNPLGVQEDAIIAEGMDSDDFSYDAVWRSEGKITDDGYVVLFSIPFKSLRFNPGSGSWGIALGRSIPQNRELSTWPLLSQKIEAYIPQFAAMSSPEGVSSHHNMQFVPYVFASQERFLDTNALPPAMTNQQIYRGGLDTKIILHDSFTIDATINPDFSQVESDEPQVTTNQRYEVFFPEKRPFFLDNSDFFQTPETLLFTRRIVDPQYGLRLTGKAGDWKIGFLGMDDRAPGQLEPIDSPLHGDRAQVYAGRVQRLFNGSSSIGGMFTRRQFGGTSTTVWSVDSRLKMGPNWVLTGQFMQSYLADPSISSQATAGTAVYADLRHVGRKFTSSTTYIDRSAAFAGNDLGFFQRTDIRQARQDLAYHWRPENGIFTSYGPEFSADATLNQAGQMQDWFMDMPLVFNLKGPSSFSFGRTESMERYQGINFRKSATYLSFSTDKSRVFGLNAFYSQGTEINFFPAAGRLPSLGNDTEASAGFTVKPGSRLQFEQKYIFSRLGESSGRGVLFENHLLRSKVNYQFTRPLSFRVIVDYNGLAGNPLLADLERTKRLNYDLLLTYMVHPGTALYVGYSDRYENLLIDPTDPLGLRRTANLNHSTSRQFFAKLSYAFHF